MPIMVRIATLLFALGFSLSAFSQISTGSSIRMIRSLSGPSGKVVGAKFVLDEIRNRFVYPQDNSLTVYFECRAPKGDYTLTAYWKDPKGVTAGISPDLKIKTVNDELNSYWIFMIDSGKASGIWTIEIRVNGEPVGAHSFELAMPEPAQPPAPVLPATPTLDEVYRSGIKSLVWVHKLDKAGQRIDTSSGFVVAPGSVLTAFQSVDGAARIEIEFADGAKSSTDEILACNRLEDWALVKTETRDVPPFLIGKSGPVVVGQQSIIFSIGSGGSRTMGVTDITGRGKVTGFGERIHINPPPDPMAIGGPLLDSNGAAIGVVGGSLVPGMWMDHRKFALNLALLGPRSSLISVTPIEAVNFQMQSQAATLQNLLEGGVLTPPLSTAPVFDSGTVIDKIASDLSYTSKAQFSRKSPEIIVFVVWKGNESLNKGAVSMNVYDAGNRIRIRTAPQTLQVPPQVLVQSQFSFKPANLETGIYRVDLSWNGTPIWRSGISIID